MHFGRLKRLAASKQARRSLAIIVLIITVAVFLRFFQTHPQYVRQLQHVSPWVIVEVIALNALLTAVLTIISNLLIRMCGKTISYKENFLLTAYSSVVNFFGPLQSGPVVRAAYFKVRHQVRVRDYTLVSLIQLAMFALISALFLFVGSLVWWVALLIFMAVGGVCFAVIRLYMKRSAAKPDAQESQLQLRPELLGALLVATLAMAVIVTGYYFIELRAIDPHITLHQAIIYSGAANFALFVSLTPDAIGIRESFLVLAKRLHHIATPVILAANVIDRAAYMLYLALLFLFVLAVHVQDRLNLKQFRQRSS